MIKNKSHFKIDNLKNIVLLGGCNFLNDIISINKKLNLKTEIISCSHQIKEFNLNKKIKKFDKLNDKFKNYLLVKYDFKNTLFISIGARWIFNKNLIENFFINNLVNFHGTRLPYDSGGGGQSWKIMRHDRIDNQLVHLVNENIDEGPILFSKSSVIPRNEIIPYQIENFRIKKFLEFYQQFIKLLKNKNSFILKHQPKYLGRYNPRLNTKLNGWIDWSFETIDLINFINAFETPYDGASTFINSKRVFIKKAQMHGGESIGHPFMSGLISRHDKRWIIVNTAGKMSLIIEKVLDNKGKNIIGQLKAGDRFITPNKYLDISKLVRARYGPKGKNIKFDQR